MKYSIRKKDGGRVYLTGWERNWNNEIFSIQLTDDLVKEVVEYNNKNKLFKALYKKFPMEFFSEINKSKLYAAFCSLTNEGYSAEEAIKKLINKQLKCKYYDNGCCLGQKYAPRVNCCGDTWFCKNYKEV